MLGPNLFFAMIYDMPKFLTRETHVTSSKAVGYADDTTVYVKAKTIKHLTGELEWIGTQMINYCNINGLKLNSQKTQILTLTKRKIEVQCCPKEMLRALFYEAKVPNSDRLSQRALNTWRGRLQHFLQLLNGMINQKMIVV